MNNEPLCTSQPDSIQSYSLTHTNKKKNKLEWNVIYGNIFRIYLCFLFRISFPCCSRKKIFHKIFHKSVHWLIVLISEHYHPAEYRWHRRQRQRMKQANDFIEWNLGSKQAHWNWFESYVLLMLVGPTRIVCVNRPATDMWPCSRVRKARERSPPSIQPTVVKHTR